MDARKTIPKIIRNYCELLSTLHEVLQRMRIYLESQTNLSPQEEAMRQDKLERLNPITLNLVTFMKSFEHYSPFHPARLSQLDYDSQSTQMAFNMLMQPFKKMMDNYRASINQGPMFTAWLKETNIRFAYPASKGVNVPNHAVVNLSTIFSISLVLKDDSERFLGQKYGGNYVASIEEFRDARELYFPYVILLFLYRILALAAEFLGEAEGTNDIMQTHVETLEKMLGIETSGDFSLKKLFMNFTQGDGLLNNLFRKFGPMLKNAGIDLDIDSLQQGMSKILSGRADASELQEKMMEIISGSNPNNPLSRLLQRLRENVDNIRDHLEITLNEFKNSDRPIEDVLPEILSRFTEDPVLQQEIHAFVESSNKAEAFESLSETGKKLVAMIKSL